MTRNEKSLQALFSNTGIIKSSREQKAISKFLDKNGNLINFDRWSYNKYNSILRKTVDSCAENLALYKDDLKKMDKFIIYETEPNGNIINTLYECSRSEFLDMVREHYKEYTGNYPDEDKFDSERWNYINSSRKPIKSSVRMIRHPSVQIYLPFTQYNNSPYNFNGIQFNDWGVRLEGSAGGSYAAESTNIDIYNDGTISVYDTKHHLDKTKYYDLELIRDFLKFFKENIDITSYLDKPTATGMVSLSSADTYKIKEWADAHKSVYSSRKPVKSSRY